MTFRLGVIVGLLAGFLLASLWCKRQPRNPAQPYKVYDQPEVDELGYQISKRKLSKKEW